MAGGYKDNEMTVNTTNGWNDIEQIRTLKISETCLGPCLLSTMKHFAEMINGFYLKTIFAKGSTMDVCQDPKQTIRPRDYSFSKYTKFSEKSSFLTAW